MPRGGRRPGAGARKGNTNAQKTAVHSRRSLLAMIYMCTAPDRKAFEESLRDAGLFHPRTMPDGTRRLVFTDDMNLALRTVAELYIDSSASEQSKTIKNLSLRELRTLAWAGLADWKSRIAAGE